MGRVQLAQDIHFYDEEMVKINSDVKIMLTHLVIESSLDLHLFSREDSSSTARTGGVVIVRLDLAGVRVHQGRLILREALPEARLAVDLIVLGLIHIVDALKRFGTLLAGEALVVPGALLGQLSLHVECSAAASPAC